MHLGRKEISLYDSILLKKTLPTTFSWSFDGSSKFFVEALEKAGVVDQEAERYYYVVKEVISFADEATGSEIILMPFT